MTSRWAKSASRGPSPSRCATRLPTESVDLGDVTDASRTTSKARCSCPEDRVPAAGGRARDGHRAGSLWPCASPQTCSAARRLPPSAPRRPRASARVRRAGPARSPLVHRLGDAARLLRGGRGSPSRSSATSPTTIAKLEPTVGLPADGPSCRRAASSSPRPSSASTTAGHGGGAGGRRGRGRRARLEEELVFQTQAPSQRATMRRTPDRAAAKRAWSGSGHIRAGDAFQVVLSQRAERQTSASALELYRALRRQPRHASSCSSSARSRSSAPRRTLVKCEDGRAKLNPIARTTIPARATRSGCSPPRRIAPSTSCWSTSAVTTSPGSAGPRASASPFLEPERFSHVTHLVSEVTGELRDGVTPFDLLRACFPAGTVSGAPKVRAMQIVSELERYRRGPYAGAVGCVLPGGAMDTCIAIRTIVLRGRRRAAAGGSRDRGRLRSGRRARGVPVEARRARGRDRPRRGAWMLLCAGQLRQPPTTSSTSSRARRRGSRLRNDAITADRGLAPTHLSSSPPAPGVPRTRASRSKLIRRLGPNVPTLGVCLGHQAIIEAFGGEIGQAKALLHGKSSPVEHDGKGVAGLPETIEAGATTRSPHLPSGRARGDRAHGRRRGDGRPPSRAADRGVQFHPESVLTPLGPRLGRTSWAAMIKQRSPTCSTAGARPPALP